MQTFTLLKKDMRLAGIFPDSSSQRLKILINFCLLGAFVVLFVATLWFLIFHAEKLTDYTESFYFNSCGWGLAMLYANYVWLGKNYAHLLDELDAIIERRSHNPKAKQIFQKTNENIENFTKNVNLLLLNAMPVVWGGVVIITELRYIFGGHDPNTLQLLYVATYPVDSKTPIGYLIAGSIQVVTNIIAALVLTITLILHAGMCLFACDMITDLEEDLRQLDEKYIKKRTNQSINGSTLGAFIRSHFEAVQFLKRYSDENKVVIFTFMVFAVFGFCCVLFQLNATLNERDYDAIVQYIICVSVGMSLLVSFCLFGDMATQRFESLNDCVYQLQWYQYPINIQKSLQLVLAMTDDIVYIEGYFSTQCTRAKLQATLNSTYSYFAILRRLY